MATVERSNSKFWRARFIGPDGKRITRSLKTRDYREAVKMAADLELAARRGRAGILTADRGRALVNEILEAVGQPTLDTVTFRAFCTRWLEGKAKTAPATLRRYKTVTEAFCASLGAAADRAVASVRPSHCEEYFALLVREGLSASTVRLHSDIITGVFARAVRQGIIAVNPVSSVELDDSTSESKEPFTDDEVSTLIEKATGDLKTIIMLGAYCGMRLDDAAKAQWSGVDFDAMTYSFVPKKGIRKNKQKLVVPLHPRLAEHLTAIAGDTCGAICPGFVGMKTGGNNGLSSRFGRFMEQCGISRSSSTRTEGRGRSVSSKSFHSFRHFFNSQLLAMGVDESIRMALSGHTTKLISRRYSHTTAAGRRAAIEKL